jgi:hypothetical protein
MLKRHIEGVLWAALFGSLMTAAFVSGRTALVVLGFICVASIAIVLPLHFYRAWKKLGQIKNQGQYAVWVGFETVAAIGLLTLGIYSLVSR